MPPNTIAMNQDGLAPCPFCGSSKVSCIEIEDFHWSVACAACQANGPTMPSRVAAVHTWEAVALRKPS
jgi:transcription elongation factor Elf1